MRIALSEKMVTLVGLLMIGGVISAPAAPSVNVESPPGVLDTVSEWAWQWDERTTVGAFEVPDISYDRRFGRHYTRGQLTLRYQLRIPEDRSRIRGIIVLIPGLDQHAGRYRYLVERLQDEFILASCDTRHMGMSNPELLGLEVGDTQPRRARHGLSRIKKFFYIIYDFDQFIHEVLPRRLAEEGFVFDEQPLILVGHSLGGLTALDYVLGNDFNLPPPNLRGVILSNPALRPPRGVPSVFQRILINYSFHVNASFGSGTEERTMFMVIYEQTRDLVMTPLFYFISLTRIPADGSFASQWVTDDPWEQIGFQTDPLTLRSNPLNFIYQVQEHMIEIRRRIPEMVCPYLLFYSQGDMIADPIGAREFAELSQGNHPLNRVVPLADTYAHEIFRARSAIRERVFDQTEAWIDDLLAAE